MGRHRKSGERNGLVFELDDVAEGNGCVGRVCGMSSVILLLAKAPSCIHPEEDSVIEPKDMIDDSQCQIRINVHYATFASVACLTQRAQTYV